MEQKRLRISTAICVAAGLVACSCDKNQLGGGAGDRTIVPVVSASDMRTKAGIDGQDGTCIASCPITLGGEDTLFLSVYEYDNHELPAGLLGQEAMTKGLVAKGSNIDKFAMDAWLESAGRSGDDPVHFMSATAEKGGSSWTLKSNDPSAPDGWDKWRNQVYTNFWCVYPASLPLDGTLGTRVITLPDDGAPDTAQKSLSMTCTVPDNASAQQDLCFAYNHQTWDETKSGNTNQVGIKFQHALSAVYLDITSLESTFASLDVKFMNVYKSGTCAISGSSTDAVGFDWTSTAPSNKGDVAQTFDGVSSVSTTDFTTSGGKRVQDFEGSDKIFMMIPQQLPDDAGMSVTFKRADNYVIKAEKPIAKFSNGDPVVWKPGKKYLYKLTKGDPLASEWKFTFSDASKSTQRSFDNTKGESSATISIISKKKKKDPAASEEDAEWVIESVQVGTNPLKTLGNGNSYEDTSEDVGITITKNGNDLEVTAHKRTGNDQGSNDYWTNRMNRADFLDWSPEDWSSKDVIDLSKYDFQTEDTDAPRTTANCYIIRHAGKYRFPLVYGNAIVNDAMNEKSYYPHVTGANFLDRFVNHNGTGIENPYIDSASSCEVLWQDEANLIQDAKVVTDTDNIHYVEFSIAQGAICQNNALIAVKDVSGNIMWSWHIWTTNDPALLESAIDVKHSYGEYKFFPLYNLGYIHPGSYNKREDVIVTLRQKVSDERIALTVKQPEVNATNYTGCWYQFGRKDPMCRKDIPVHSSPNGGFYKVGSQVPLQDAIRNPNKLYFCHTKDWCNQTYYNLWTGISSSGGIKTVYDPSPRGYRVPPHAAIRNLSKTGYLGYGLNFDTGFGGNIFFPFSGYRYNGDGGAGNVGGYGYYWSADSINPNQAGELQISSSGIYSKNGNVRSNGYSVRPILE